MTIEKNGILRHRLLAKGEIVAQFLNVADGLAKQKRILDLLERYRELQNLLPAVVSARPLGRVQGGPSAGALVYNLGENKKAARLVREINRLLEHPRNRFRWGLPSTLLVNADEAARLETETYPVRSVPFSNFEHHSTIEEHGAMLQVIELAAAGELDRLRKCAFCSDWFMASRTDRIYHEGCAAKQHRKGRKESGIAAKYQKWYRKYAPVKELKSDLEKLHSDGIRLSKEERIELRQMTEEAKRLKDEWKATLRKLKRESARDRAGKA